jgi:hypothetical protein
MHAIPKRSFNDSRKNELVHMHTLRVGCSLSKSWWYPRHLALKVLPKKVLAQTSTNMTEKSAFFQGARLNTVSKFHYFFRYSMLFRTDDEFSTRKMYSVHNLHPQGCSTQGRTYPKFTVLSFWTRNCVVRLFVLVPIGNVTIETLLWLVLVLYLNWQ